MLGIERVFEPIELADVQRRSQEALSRGIKMKKLGLAVAVYDENGNMLVLEHRERRAEYSHGDLGPIMETSKYVVGTTNTIESPYQTWLRSLKEELEIGEIEFKEAGLFIGRQTVINAEPWIYGERSNGHEIQADAFNMSVRTSNPSVFINRSSPEIANTYFIDPLEILCSKKVHLRPGFADWTERMTSSSVVIQDDTLDLEWQSLPEVSEGDVTFPYNGYGG